MTNITIICIILAIVLAIKYIMKRDKASSK